jgi:hypothetical protein
MQTSLDLNKFEPASLDILVIKLEEITKEVVEYIPSENSTASNLTDLDSIVEAKDVEEVTRTVPASIQMYEVLAIGANIKDYKIGDKLFIRSSTTFPIDVFKNAYAVKEFSVIGKYNA